MANTEAYKLFLTQAKNAGLLNEFSPQDLQIAAEHPEFGTSLLGLKQDYRKSNTDEGKSLAHAAAEQLREKYSAMSPATVPAKTPGAFSSGIDYKGTLAQLEKMSYPEWQKGETYGELEKNYTAAGQKAMQDTLAQVSSRTGGIASSYAGGAAQGAYNEYMRGLDEAARQQYLAERGELTDLLQLQMSADNTEYSRMLDQIAAEQNAEALGYERAQAADALSFERQLLERQEAQETVNNMIAMGATLADIPADLLVKSGYGESYVNVGNADYKRQTAPKVTGVETSEPAAPVYGETLSQGQVSELLSKYGKNKTLTADEWDALGRMGYTLDYESGKVVYNQQQEESEGNSALYNQLMSGFKTMQSYESKERLRELLISVMDQLSDEEVESIMETYGL